VTDRRQHWNGIYGSRREQDLSWFETCPETSLQMIRAAGLGPGTCIVDIGGGDSRLVDALVAAHVRCIAVLDVSGTALRRAQQRLGPAAAAVTWVESDVTADWSLPPMDIWHDRAVFHFLTASADRARYIWHMRHVLKPNGTAIIATFSLDGPETCSGLPVVRYSPGTLAAELGPGFERVESIAHDHRTPSGVAQPFQYSRFLRSPDVPGAVTP